ncbi:hypothetical protein IV203_011889 [Nitzschia inconspicua]|uniref:Uncharacterized protein n=1 Tax=Nitzschia inconspicua TaxID=303405 RepID=A0A9K3KT62_9STRA|nr:hypothetical protein IV203_011889 [Nitzschia inconspicua]
MFLVPPSMCFYQVSQRNGSIGEQTPPGNDEDILCNILKQSLRTVAKDTILCSNCSNTFNKVFGVIDPSLLNYSLNLEVLLSLLNHLTDGLGISHTARYRPQPLFLNSQTVALRFLQSDY